MLEKLLLPLPKPEWPSSWSLPRWRWAETDLALEGHPVLHRRWSLHRESRSESPERLGKALRFEYGEREGMGSSETLNMALLLVPLSFSGILLSIQTFESSWWSRSKQKFLRHSFDPHTLQLEMSYYLDDVGVTFWAASGAQRGKGDLLVDVVHLSDRFVRNRNINI